VQQRSGANGHAPDGDAGTLDPADEAALDALDADPLDADEAAAGAAAASDAVDGSLDERVDAVVDELGGVERRGDDVTVELFVNGVVFAVLAGDTLEAGLEPTVLAAALRTPDTAPSSRGPGWIAFTPGGVDRYALDRAEAWVRLAYRRATGR
jgi:hypothetical protein